VNAPSTIAVTIVNLLALNHGQPLTLAELRHRAAAYGRLHSLEELKDAAEHAALRELVRIEGEGDELSVIGTMPPGWLVVRRAPSDDVAFGGWDGWIAKHAGSREVKPVQELKNV
jgi:hypothetical protein